MNYTLRIKYNKIIFILLLGVIIGVTFSKGILDISCNSSMVSNTGMEGWDPSISSPIISTSSPHDDRITYYNISTGTITDTGLIGHNISMSGSFVTFTSSQISYYDISNGTVVNTGVEGEYPSMDGDIIAFVKKTPMAQEKTIKYYNISSMTVTDTYEIGRFPSISGSIIAFGTFEWAIHADHNGDGDALDEVIRYYNISNGVTTNTSVCGSFPSISGPIIAFMTEEHADPLDLNEDGDFHDDVVRYINLSSGNVINTGLDGNETSICDSIIAFTTFEGDFAGIGQDLNGDGDTRDLVIRYYSILNDTVVNTGADGCNPSINSPTIAFCTWEPLVSEDLNEDGDTNDGVIRYLVLSSSTPSSISEIKSRVFPASSNSLYFVPTGNIYDDSALYAFYSYKENPQIITSPTQSSASNAYIDGDGSPLFAGDIVTFGGRFANRMVKYYEDTGIAKVGFLKNGTHRVFTRISDGAHLYAVDSSTYDSTDKDYFVFQVYRDGNRYIFSEWGIHAEGTYAGGVCFIDIIYPNLQDYTPTSITFSLGPIPIAMTCPNEKK